MHSGGLGPSEGRGHGISGDLSMHSGGLGPSGAVF